MNMPATYSTPAIVLSRRAGQGINNRVSLYTLERGKVELIVKGARRSSSRLSAHLEPLTLLDLMVVSGQAYDFAGGASSRDCYPNLKADFEKITAAGRGIRYVNRLLKENVKDDEIFYLTSDFLSLLDRHSAEGVWYEWLANVFLYKILDHLGYGLADAQERGLPGREETLSEIISRSSSRMAIKQTNKFLEKWIRETAEF